MRIFDNIKPHSLYMFSADYARRSAVSACDGQTVGRPKHIPRYAHALHMRRAIKISKKVKSTDKL